MSTTSLVLATDTTGLAAAAALARSLGEAAAIVVGPADLAAAAAAYGLPVTHLEPAPDVPAEAYSAAVADLVEHAAPRVVLGTAAPGTRVLVGAASARLGAALVAGVVGLARDGDTVLVDRAVASGDAIETLEAPGPLAVIVTADDPDDPPTGPGTVTVASAEPVGAMTVVAREATAAATGVTDAARVVSVGRGVRARDDLAMVEALAAALDAEIACTMPVADDLGWIEKSRYIGRSGQHINPQLYVAIGISGSPQHMEGVRGARTVVAVNNDPDARILKVCDLGIVGDLYDVLPELTARLS